MVISKIILFHTKLKLWKKLKFNLYLGAGAILWLWTMRASSMDGVGTRLVSYTFVLELRNVNNGCVAM
jgi:hypothetical protein